MTENNVADEEAREATRENTLNVGKEWRNITAINLRFSYSLCWKKEKLVLFRELG
jgi:hypothetical protein